jgi:hypothetical protein
MGRNTNSLNLSDEDIVELAKQVLKGYTGGLLDGEDKNGLQYRISWELNYNKFKNN